MFIKKLRFRNKLLFTFLVVFIPLILIGSTLAYYHVKKILQARIEEELQDTTDIFSNLIKTSAAVSIKTRLHAIAEKNLNIAEHYYNKYQSGLLNRSEAIDTIEEIFLSQSVGISGYIYCLNSKGMVIVHPNEKVKNSDVSGFDFVKHQLKIKDGYLEYDWKNPGEPKERPKALYMVYFKPLDWIISVSSYREEFNRLMDIDDFKESLLTHKTGKTDHVFVIDEQGVILVDPDRQGEKPLHPSEYPDDFFKQILKEKNGKIKYLWKNPSEPNPRERMVIFKHLPEYKWIVASSSDVEEVFAPLKIMRNVLIIALIIVVLVSVGITYVISTSITKPLVSLMDNLEEGAKGDFSVRMEEGASDEFGKLARHFNSFMAQLERNHEKIEVETRKNIESQAALVENDLKLRSLFNQSFQYTGILSPSGVLEEVNQAGIEFAGCTVEEVVYQPFWQGPWWRHDRKTQQTLKTAVKKATQGGLVRYETTNISKEGVIRDIDISIKPIFNSSGEVAFIIAEGRDITDYKLAALERKNLAVQLEKSQKMEAIGTLAGGIAHDFNNILSGILGYAQLAELNLDNPIKAKGHMLQIVKGAQRAAGLIQQILTFSRQTEYEKHPLSLYLVVKEALKLLRSSIPTTIDIREEIVSKAKILADPTQMHQVIMNLCTNAYHAMEEKGGVLAVRLDEVAFSGSTRDAFDQDMKKGTYLELEIADTGCGMDDEIMIKAFDPYFTTKPVGKGTGFGLALVHAIVDEHDGYIKVKSLPGKGSHFYIYLPVASDKEIPDTGKNEEKSCKRGTENIMVVDDEESIRQIVQEFLTTCGYTVSTFENGVSALEAFKKAPEQFDLIVTDMTMPQMTGWELSQKLLRLRKNLPIILCTGYSESISEAKALEIGIRKYVQKPFTNEALAGSIREILDTDEGKKAC